MTLGLLRSFFLLVLGILLLSVLVFVFLAAFVAHVRSYRYSVRTGTSARRLAYNLLLRHPSVHRLDASPKGDRHILLRRLRKMSQSPAVLKLLLRTALLIVRGLAADKFLI